MAPTIFHIAESCNIPDAIENSETLRNMFFRECHFLRPSARSRSTLFLTNLLFSILAGKRVSPRKFLLAQKKLLPNLYC